MASAPDPISDYKIEVFFKDKDIVGIKLVGVLGDSVTPGDINRYKKSPYGLRVVDSVSHTQQVEAITVETVESLATNCYMIIGGFKVKVPC